MFSSYARLIGKGAQSDADNGRDVYRYDAETGVLDRVSLGEDGYDVNGNGNGESTINLHGVLEDSATVSHQYELAERAISDDGSRIIFSSVEPLSPAAINGKQNVYIWHEEPGWSVGRVSLVSSGSSLTNDIFPVISADGLSVFFSTSQGLVAVDTEGDLDVYDARVNGGFPLRGVAPEPCSSDACQGALTNPAPLLVPGSVSQAPGGDFARPASKSVKKTAAGHAKKRGPGKRKHRVRKATHTGRGRAGVARGSRAAWFTPGVGRGR